MSAATELEDYKRAFHFFDTNHDGKITIEELEAAMNKCGQHPSKLELRLLMMQADTDRNGVITFDEFTQMMRDGKKRCKYSREQLYEQFQLFDKDKDGYIERNEMSGIVYELELGKMFPEKLIDQIFQEADVDGDGRISFEEFVLAVN
ncbi:Calmodulin [Toxocara canis]|uniref:Calmodulin n=1 Tax=Toxocara canis TaxID=6265 RepID=A0A0B2VR52_TOXCA|nr:Calmodulin [Toxocara canis]